MLLPKFTSHRYAVVSGADSVISAFSALFRKQTVIFTPALVTDSLMNISTSLILCLMLLTTGKQVNTLRKTENSFFDTIASEKKRFRYFQNHF